MSTFRNKDLQRIEGELKRESEAVGRYLDLEKFSGWNDAIPSRLLVEVLSVDGLWNTSKSWFFPSKAFVQVEFGGLCFNSKPTADTKEAFLNELFVFPGSKQVEAFDNEFSKLYISVMTVEGSDEVPNEANPKGEDTNTYRRLSEYSLDLATLKLDQLVHELTLHLPVRSSDPPEAPLRHPLRQCDLSGLFGESDIEDQQSQIEQISFKPLMVKSSSDPLPKTQLNTLATEQSRLEDSLILDLISEIDEKVGDKAEKRKRKTKKEIKVKAYACDSLTNRNSKPRKNSSDNAYLLPLFDPERRDSSCELQFRADSSSP